MLRTLIPAVVAYDNNCTYGLGITCNEHSHCGRQLDATNINYSNGNSDLKITYYVHTTKMQSQTHGIINRPTRNKCRA
jgi:hypothetical protein